MGMRFSALKHDLKGGRLRYLRPVAKNDRKGKEGDAKSRAVRSKRSSTTQDHPKSSISVKLLERLTLVAYIKVERPTSGARKKIF